MAQHSRTVVTYNQNFDTELETEFHQCSVSDTVTLEGAVNLEDSYKVAAAIIEAYRFRGYSIDEQFQMIRDQIAEWDENKEYS